MLTRSTRKLPPDFNENQPVGINYKMKKTHSYVEQRRQILEAHPTLPAAFPTRERPPTPPPPASPKDTLERPMWIRGRNRDRNNDGTAKRRIDMTGDDLYEEVMGDNTFLTAPTGCLEADLPDFGQGDYRNAFVKECKELKPRRQRSLNPLKPGKLEFDLFYDFDSSDNHPQETPSSSEFKDLASGVKLAIMIEAVAEYTIMQAPEVLRLTRADVDDYVALYEKEAANDAANAYNVEKENEWESMHRMQGNSDFELYDPPERRPTFRSALSLIKAKDIEAGKRYLSLINQKSLADKLEGYVGCAGRNVYSFKHPKEPHRAAPGQSGALPLAFDLLDNVSVDSSDEEVVVRDRRRRGLSDANSAILVDGVLVVQKTGLTGSFWYDLPEGESYEYDQNFFDAPYAAAGNEDDVPLLARPPKRRKLHQGRRPEPPLPQQSSGGQEENGRPFAAPPVLVSPEKATQYNMPEQPRTPSPSLPELVRDMSSAIRRSVSRPEDEPVTGRSITSSPLTYAAGEPRRPRVARIDRPGLNPNRHSSGSHPGSATRGDRKTLRADGRTPGAYRPERQWAHQLPSSPLRPNIPRPATPRSGSKEYFLGERQSSHPPSSPRLFDESGKTVRDRPQTPQEVQKIFEMQQKETRLKRIASFPSLSPSTPRPALPYSATLTATTSQFTPTLPGSGGLHLIWFERPADEEEARKVFRWQEEANNAHMRGWAHPPRPPQLEHLLPHVGAPLPFPKPFQVLRRQKRADRAPTQEEMQQVVQWQEQANRQYSLGQLDVMGPSRPPQLEPFLPPTDALLPYEKPFAIERIWAETFAKDSVPAESANEPLSTLPSKKATSNSSQLFVVEQRTVEQSSFQHSAPVHDPHRSEAILPSATGPLGGVYQAPLTGQSMSNQPATRFPSHAQTPTRQPSSTVPSNNDTPKHQHPVSAAAMLSRSVSTTNPFLPVASSNVSSQSNPIGLSLGLGEGLSVPSISTQPEYSLRTSQLPSKRPGNVRPQIEEPAKKTSVKQKVRRTKTRTNPAPAESMEERLSPVKFDEDKNTPGPPKLKSTYKPQAQPPHARPVERQTYQPPHQWTDSGSPANEMNGTAPSISATPQPSNHQAQPNVLKRSHTVGSGLSGTGNGMMMTNQQLAGPQSLAFSPYNNSFAAHPTATFEATAAQFDREVPKKYGNQHSAGKVNALQGPVNLHAAPRTPNLLNGGSTPRSTGETPAPNPFRQRQTFQSPVINNGYGANHHNARPPPVQHHNQYPQPPPAKKVKVSRQSQSSPDHTPSDRSQQTSVWVSSQSMPGALLSTPDRRSNSQTPQPYMPGGSMAGVLGLPGNADFTQVMKRAGVQLPNQTAQAGGGLMKRAPKVQAQPQMMDYMNSGMAAPPMAPSGPPPPLGRYPADALLNMSQPKMARPSGNKKARGPAKTARETQDKANANQAPISQYLGPPRRPSGGGGMY